MLKTLGSLRWTVLVYTAPCDELLIFLNGTSAVRTLITSNGKHVERLCIRRSQIFNHGNDSWYNITAFLNNHRITFANVFTENLFIIMESCSTNSRSIKKDRLKFCYGRKRSSPPNLNRNAIKARLRLLWRILVSHRPTRSFSSCSNSISQIKPVKFYDSTICIIIKTSSNTVELFNRRNNHLRT